MLSGLKPALPSVFDPEMTLLRVGERCNLYIQSSHSLLRRSMSPPWTYLGPMMDVSRCNKVSCSLLVHALMNQRRCCFEEWCVDTDVQNHFQSWCWCCHVKKFLTCLRGNSPPACWVSFLYGLHLGGYSSGVLLRIRAAMDQDTGPSPLYFRGRRFTVAPGGREQPTTFRNFCCYSARRECACLALHGIVRMAPASVRTRDRRTEAPQTAQVLCTPQCQAITHNPENVRRHTRWSP